MNKYSKKLALLRIKVVLKSIKNNVVFPVIILVATISTFSSCSFNSTSPSEVGKIDSSRIAKEFFLHRGWEVQLPIDNIDSVKQVWLFPRNHLKKSSGIYYSQRTNLSELILFSANNRNDITLSFINDKLKGVFILDSVITDTSFDNKGAIVSAKKNGSNIEFDYDSKIFSFMCIKSDSIINEKHIHFCN